ncbi:rhodanese-like domain-containing protein [Glaciecola petra]|uniref:Rhodanese-like domain-containing protein n=1 Tax=Glaciecola petra TaxID=3075602 RepID=A0ABU2ZUE9_9ALTE|nr:rhodanese-like domain-containing protein [Aestuariibacter sp. P117]MDT0596264.1 rhodanese-like domain-containing protein [Aestuariibacter sp. P117]
MKLLTGRQLVSYVQLEIQQCDCAALARAIKQNAIVIDIREESEVILGMVPGATHIPRGVLEMEITSHASVKNCENPLVDLAENPIYLYCRSGARSALAAKSLSEMGLKNVWSVAGGFNDWQLQERPIISNKEAKVWEVDGLFAWEQGGGI